MRVETIDIGRNFKITSIEDKLKLKLDVKKQVKKFEKDPCNQNNQILKQETHAYDETKVEFK